MVKSTKNTIVKIRSTVATTTKSMKELGSQNASGTEFSVVLRRFGG